MGLLGDAHKFQELFEVSDRDIDNFKVAFWPYLKYVGSIRSFHIKSQQISKR